MDLIRLRDGKLETCGLEGPIEPPLSWSHTGHRLGNSCSCYPHTCPLLTTSPPVFLTPWPGASITLLWIFFINVYALLVYVAFLAPVRV